MSRGSLLKISVAISAEAEDAVSEVLRDVLGEPGSVYHDLELNTFTASVYLPNVADWNTAGQRALKTGLARVRASGLDLGRDNGRVTVEKVKREDWAESWKRHFKAISIGTALLVKPSWVKRAPRKGQAVVVLDPGLSFGTGQHPTTRFCLGQLVAAARAGRKESFLDVGTGSGILAISAVKLGFEVVEAFDFDPESIRVAKVNAAKNRTTKRMKLSRGDLTRLPLKSRRNYHVVCANLIYDLLLAERARILNRLAPEGTLVLAGILRTQFAEVRAAYESAGLRWVAGQVENEWESGAFAWA